MGLSPTIPPWSEQSGSGEIERRARRVIAAEADTEDWSTVRRAWLTNSLGEPPARHPAREATSELEDASWQEQRHARHAVRGVSRTDRADVGAVRDTERFS